ncbi:MAG: acetolactate synthase [Planctomycetes bacterium]|nr:acetolactate synthase [Planctomycetota bacterium]
MDTEPFDTLEAQGAPTVRQHSVFVENRVGQLLRLTKLFDEADVRILALSVVHSVDCAICRMILDDPDKAYDIFSNSRFQVSECELLVVSLPHGKRALLGTWMALLSGEVNIYYTYPLIVHPRGSAALAVLPDNIEQAVVVLRERGFELLDEQDLRDTRNQ